VGGGAAASARRSAASILLEAAIMQTLRSFQARSFLGSLAVLWVASAVVGGCGGDDDTSAGAGGSGGRQDAGANDHEAGTGASQDAPGAAGGDTVGGVGDGTLGTPSQLATGSPSVVGVTSDGWVLYRAGDVLQGLKLGDDQPVDVSDEPGNVLVKGKVVYNFANMDWTKNVGDLSIWSDAGGAQSIGSTTYSESLIAASESGDWLVYPADTRSSKTNLMIASSDFSTNDVLIEGMGLGNDTTCSPTLGFVGERLIVGYCEPDSRDASIVRFEWNEKNGFVPTTLAEQTLPTWSADATGDGLFYQSSNYEGFYTDGGEPSRIDASVSRGFLLPDGSAVLYTVGDQLRRSSVPDSNPVPIVTTGFSEPVAFTEDYGEVLYSSKVTYENGTQRDLRLVATDGFNPEPIELVAEPTASVGRSTLTTDGNYALYLDDVTARGGTLHVVDMKGHEVLSFAGVLDVLAAGGSAILFTDNASDPDVYPNVADLEYVDVSKGKTPALVEGAILEPKNFQVDADFSRVIYVRSGVDRDSEDPLHAGLFVLDLP
jgi:hypothetical protein